MPDQRPSQRAKRKSREPKSQKVRQLENALNIIMYIPVAVQAAGGKPSPMIIGFQTTPPPRPTEEANPPPTAPRAKSYSDLPW